MADALEGLDRGLDVHIHLAHVAYIDHGCLDLLRGFESAHREAGGTVSIDWNDPAARHSNLSIAQAGHAAAHEAMRTKPCVP